MELVGRTSPNYDMLHELMIELNFINDGFVFVYI